MNKKIDVIEMLNEKEVVKSTFDIVHNLLDKLFEEFTEQDKENERLKEENEKLKKVLRRLEWLNAKCPVCGEKEVDNHIYYCWLGNLLKEVSE
ncbi:MAG: hypothetical protein WC477_06075 [Patescibacteria group bacterium]